jgi:SAM-dependent methyltransferase
MATVIDDKVLEERTEAFVERIFGAAVGAGDLFLMDLGVRLGLYAALHDAGVAGSQEIADRTGCSERYVREWLEQQAVAGILDIERAEGGDALRYSLPEAHARCLLDPDSLNYVGAIAKATTVFGRAVEWVADAFRTGEGIPYERYGLDGVEVQAEFTRPMFKNLLTTEWLPSLPEVHGRLLSDPPAKVADIACGVGIAAIEIAKAYPKVSIDGLDLDETSIAIARRNATEAAVTDRVRFEVRDGADSDGANTYDVVTIFEAIHDMSDPISVLKGARQLLADGGTLIVADEHTGESVTDPGPIDSFFYIASVLYCLPQSLASQPSAAIGTVIRTPTMKSLGHAAGFSRVEILPIENDFWTFYKLIP